VDMLRAIAPLELIHAEHPATMVAAWITPIEASRVPVAAGQVRYGRSDRIRNALESAGITIFRVLF
jgi:hypothetical protein